MTNEEITIQYLTTEFNNFKARCAELEKENAKLRERLNSVNQTNNYYEEKERYALAEHNENIQLKAQIEKYKIEKEYYDNLCHKKTIECDDLRKGIKQFQSDNEKFIKKITELRGKLERVSEWVKEQEYPDGCIDCESWDTEKLKEILK